MAGKGKPGRPKKDMIEIEPDEFSDAPEDLAEVFDALPGEEKVISLYRIPVSGPPTFLIGLSPDGLRSLSSIQEEFGGGKYKAVAKNYETGQKLERTFSIEGDPKVKGEKVVTKDPKTGFFRPKAEWTKEPGYEEARENGNLSETMFHFYERQLDKLTAEVERLKSEKPSNGMNDALQLIIQAKELIAPQVPLNQGTVDAQTIFNAMTKGMEMINDRDNENSQPPWIAVARELLPTIQQIVNRVTNASGPGKPGQPPPPPTNLPPKDVTPPTPFQALIPMLEPHKETFIDAAAQNDDPFLLIPMVARRIPPEKKDEIIKWIQEEKWFGDLVSLDQRISLQRGWWDEFVKGLLAVLKGEAVEGQEEPA